MRAVIVVLAGHKHNHALPHQKKDDFSSLEFLIQSKKEFIVFGIFNTIYKRIYCLKCIFSVSLQVT